jgi:hypothetical protein
MKLIIKLVFLFSVLNSVGQGRVDGFFKGQGNLDVVFSGGYEDNKSYFAGTNKISLGREIVIANVYLAYGITNRLDVNFSLPYISVNKNTKGIQDASLFVKYRLWNISNASPLFYYLPKGYSATLSVAGGVSSNFTDYQTEGGNALGQQAKTIDLRPVLQVPLKNGIFATLQAGYTYKFDPVPNSFSPALKIGIAKGNIYADVWYEYQHSFGGLDYQGTPKPKSFQELGVDFHKIGATIYKPIKKRFGVFVGATYILTGRNTSQGLGLNAGIVLKHSKKK